jgi:hypothetical protein
MKAPATLILAAFAVLLAAREGFAGIDLVTLPERSSVQLTIYNSADLTLVREVRNLTLQKGPNKLSFGWANTLIDPTSLDLRAMNQPDAVSLLDVSFPPGVNSQAIWTVESKVAGEVPVQITFFTSGLTWRAFYMGTLAKDEKEMLLEGYVRVQNNSGEDYADAQTRMIVGRIHLLDQIAELARRAQPYGRPGVGPGVKLYITNGSIVTEYRAKLKGAADQIGGLEEVKTIIKEGLSEYFLYTIEGTETIPNEWSKRLPAFKPVRVPVINLFKYDEERFGADVVRMLYFKNDKAHNLGETPLPDGNIRISRTVDEAGHLSYEGVTDVKYIPVDQEVELNLGPNESVKVEPKVMKTSTSQYLFDRNKRVNGWDATEDWKVEVKNLRDVPAKIEITRHMKHQYFDDIKRRGDFGQFEKVDLNTIKFTLLLDPHSTKSFTYSVTYHEEERRVQG